MVRAPASGPRGASTPGRSTGANAPSAEEAPPASPEALLAAVAQSCDREAFRQLFRTFAPTIKRYLCARGAAEALAEEVVQEAMLKVWRKARLYDAGKASAGTWIYSIARHCMLDRVRGESRPEIEEDDPERVPPIAPDEQLLLAEERQALARAIQELPEAQVEVLRSAYFEGLSMQQIAERQALPLGTVKTRSRSALERLRILLRRLHA